MPTPGSSEPAVTLPWLVRLRWLFIAGQLVVLPLAHVALGIQLVWWLVAAVLVAGTLSNVALAVRGPRAANPARLMGGMILLDIGLLTAQLGAHGGATNPFAVFYLVYITLSAVVLSARWTTSVALLAIAGYALLFTVPADLHVHHAGSAFGSSHLQGMWAAFVLAAILVAFFARRITQAIASQREQIARLRETATRNAQLASLATLAAGAAHELNSPLSTIAVAAHEAKLHSASAGTTAVSADLALILEEVDRCQAILHQMAARSTRTDDIEQLAPTAVVARLRTELGPERCRSIEIAHAGDDAVMAVPAAPLVQSIVALVKNALDASPPEHAVQIGIERDHRALRVAITDRGSGIAADVLAKVGEPFFTTKAPGHGMGLGVFLARVFAESRGGALAIDSTPGAGTRALLTLPLGEPA